MNILAIETSCDETAVAVLDARGEIERARFAILGNALLSQADKHAAYGGVYPTLAKREHQNNLVPLAMQALEDAGMLSSHIRDVRIRDELLEPLRDPAFKDAVRVFLKSYEKPDIDCIAVTKGPGLEPALWTGITFAEALSEAWGIPLMGIDHLEGHILSALLKPAVTDQSFVVSTKANANQYELHSPDLPLLTLVISGGHTEFSLMSEWLSFAPVGETRDDAVGEAFDKVARLLDLTYPGGPKIAELAERSRVRGSGDIRFPRPMAHDATCDFSFSGLKTAVLYKLRNMDKISEVEKEHIAEAFEDAVRDVIVLKTRRALTEHAPRALVVGGGVSANTHIKNGILSLVKEEFPDVFVSFPIPELTGDNAIMIGAAAYVRNLLGKDSPEKIVAQGNLRLGAT